MNKSEQEVVDILRAHNDRNIDRNTALRDTNLTLGKEIAMVREENNRLKHNQLTVERALARTLGWVDAKMDRHPTGEVSEAEGTVIKYEPGGSFSHVAKMPYKEGMEFARCPELRIKYLWAKTFYTLGYSRKMMSAKSII